MSRILPSLVFFAVTFAVFGLLHGYLWHRLVRAPRWPAPWSRLLSGLLIGAAILLPVGMVGSRLVGREWGGPLAFAAYTWMGLGFLLFLTLAAAHLLLAAGELVRRRRRPVDPARRQFLARSSAEVASIATLGLGFRALDQGLGLVGVEEVEVELERLPRALDGFTLIQLTDVHVGPTIGREFVEEVVERTNAFQPDAVVITGDLVDGSVEELAWHVEPLRRLSARHGVFFVTGNHEYYSGAEPWIAHLESLGIRVLRNERVSLGSEEASFDLAGVNDYKAGRFGDPPDLARALAGRDPGRELVLLAHQPAEVENAARHGVGLQISGHTHGGQIWPFALAVGAVQPYVSGLHRHGARTQIYVSRGTGYWGPPMRLGAPSEITRLTLRAAGAGGTGNPVAGARG